MVLCILTIVLMVPPEGLVLVLHHQMLQQKSILTDLSVFDDEALAMVRYSFLTQLVWQVGKLSLDRVGHLEIGLLLVILVLSQQPILSELLML